MKKTITAIVLIFSSSLFAGEQSGGGFFHFNNYAFDDCGYSVEVSPLEYEALNLLLEEQDFAYIPHTDIPVIWSDGEILVGEQECLAPVTPSDFLFTE